MARFISARRVVTRALSRRPVLAVLVSATAAVAMATPALAASGGNSGLQDGGVPGVNGSVNTLAARGPRVAPQASGGDSANSVSGSASALIGTVGKAVDSLAGGSDAPTPPSTNLVTNAAAPVTTTVASTVVPVGAALDNTAAPIDSGLSSTVATASNTVSSAVATAGTPAVPIAGPVNDTLAPVTTTVNTTVGPAASTLETIVGPVVQTVTTVVAPVTAVVQNTLPQPSDPGVTPSGPLPAVGGTVSGIAGSVATVLDGSGAVPWSPVSKLSAALSGAPASTLPPTAGGPGEVISLAPGTPSWLLSNPRASETARDGLLGDEQALLAELHLAHPGISASLRPSLGVAPAAAGLSTAVRSPRPLVSAPFAAHRSTDGDPAPAVPASSGSASAPGFSTGGFAVIALAALAGLLLLLLFESGQSKRRRPSLVYAPIVPPA